MHIYDYIIIGSGLTGLTIAKKLSQETDNILILEAQDVVGGNNRSISFAGSNIENGLRHMPYSDAALKSIHFLEELTGLTLGSKIKSENNVETYDASGFKSFVGFGSNPPEFYEQLSYFLNPNEVQLESSPSNWISHLAEQLQNKIQTKSIVTRFVVEGLEADKPVLNSILVNGTKTFYAHNFIFTGPVKELALLLSDDVFAARHKAKLKKALAWQTVCLDLSHTFSCEKQNMFILNGTTDDEIGPCIGRFLPKATPIENQTSQNQISQWLSFIDSESAEDTENIGLVLKKMKRQIKRAFPELSETIIKERIFISPPISGADLKLNANGSFPKLPNLWVASSQLSPFPNLVGSLMQAQMFLQAVGAVPADLGQQTTENEALI